MPTVKNAGISTSLGPTFLGGNGEVVSQISAGLHSAVSHLAGVSVSLDVGKMKGSTDDYVGMVEAPGGWFGESMRLRGLRDRSHGSWKCRVVPPLRVLPLSGS